MKNNGTFSSKSRPLRPQLGSANDDLYFASSGGGQPWSWYSDIPLSSQEAILKSWYNYGKANRGTSSGFAGWPMGSESINCTVGRRMNNCTHVKQKSVQYPTTMIHASWDYVSIYYEMYYRHPVIMNYYRNAVNDCIELLSGRGFDPLFSARAYWSMRPKWEGDVSLINSIFELKDFVDVIPALTAVGKFYKNPVPSIMRLITAGKTAVRKMPTLSIGEFVQNSAWFGTKHSTKLAADAVLTMNLAIKPTISDCMAITGQIQKDMEQQYRQFKNYGEEGARSHYSEKETISQKMTDLDWNNHFLSYGSSFTLKRTATAISYYTALWDDFNSRYNKWWGWDIGTEALWNMLPLSFLLDYILTVGKSLKYMDVDKNLQVHHVEYCESVKIVHSTGTFVRQHSGVPLLGIDGVLKPATHNTKYHLVTGTEGSAYQRKVMDPYKGPALPQLKCPSSTQAENMLALARCLLFR